MIVVHGGPGAPGHMAPVARGLADAFRVVEPFQRPSGGEPLTVARHVADLRELAEAEFPGARPALVGSSWGAMLALAFTAEHPDLAGPLVLVGCGTFDPVARAQFRTNLDARIPAEREPLAPEDLLPFYSFDLVTSDTETAEVDRRANEETWSDMLRLQEQGVYPAAFRAIHGPVLMLHGAVDPHPGWMIRASLQQVMPQLEYREWERCGHYPWLERAVRDPFFAVLREWLARFSSPPPAT